MKKRAGAGNKYRNQAERKARATILIVCESEKTEPIYFDHWRVRCRDAADIRITRARGTDPKSIVETAKDLATARDYNQVWCVFDCDEHKKIGQAVIQARDNDIAIAFSNPCFELWFLLHFKDQTRHIERGDVSSLLKKRHLKGYEKAADVYEKLLPRQSAAIKRAEKLRSKHHRDGNPETHNPSTGVDALVLELNKLRPGGMER